jgi:hypothetical protein
VGQQIQELASANLEQVRQNPQHSRNKGKASAKRCWRRRLFDFEDDTLP